MRRLAWLVLPLLLAGCGGEKSSPRKLAAEACDLMNRFGKVWLVLKLALALCATLLTACAADTMRSYMGQDIRNVELSGHQMQSVLTGDHFHELRTWPHEDDCRRIDSAGFNRAMA
jgi:predicted small secreted protein